MTPQTADDELPGYRRVLADLYRRAHPREQALPQPPAQAELAIPYRATGEFLNWSDAGVVQTARKHRDGVPLSRQGGRWVHNPVTTAVHGLAAYGRWLRSGEPSMLDAAIRQAEWLVERQAPSSGAWYYDFDFQVAGMDPSVRLHAPWASAMGQGLAMSLLTRTVDATNDPRYLASARKGLQPLSRAVSAGGLVADFRGHPYFEEYPTEPASFTLNGLMFTLLGLYDLSQVRCTLAERLFTSGIETLVLCLPEYETGGISAYHLGFMTNGQPRHCSLHYHWVHVRQLSALQSVAPHPVLLEYRDRWSAYRPKHGDPR